MTFVPFDATEDEAAEWAVLRPGVPSTMRPALVTWIWSTLKNESDFIYPDTVRRLSNALDLDFHLNEEFDGIIKDPTFRKLTAHFTDRELLRLTDFQVSKDRYNRHHNRLSTLLANGRSAYHVVQRGEKDHRLAHRVPEGVQDAAEAIAATDTSAGKLLRKAWENAFELTPQDSAAYFYAVRAVESAAFKTLEITDPTATLGNAIRAIEKHDAQWRLPFLREHTQYPSKDLLLGTLKSLYKGHRDRHGSIDAYSDVTHDEAEGAVLLAVTLVGWFSRDLVVERDPESFG